MKYKLTNEKIYSTATLLEKYPIPDSVYIPAVANFYVQKNISLLLSLKEELEQCRFKIISHYGEDNGDGSLKIKPEHIEVANQELKALSEIEQDVEIQMIPITALFDAKLSVGQIKSLMFMLEEDPEVVKTKEKNSSNAHSTYVSL